MHALPSLEETNVIIELLYSKIFNTSMVRVKIKKIPTVSAKSKQLKFYPFDAKLKSVGISP
jgi:hypothetical protein